MSIFEMWKLSSLVYALLVLINFTLFSIGQTMIWIIAGVIILLCAAYFTLKQGMDFGHAACSVSKSIQRVSETKDKPNDVDAKMQRQAWSKATGIKSIFSGAAVGYIINCIYIILMMTGISDTLMFVFRLMSWVTVMPYWPIVAYWYPTFTTLTPAIVALLMVSPFFLPVIQYIGYLQGPKLWASTEQAMAKGKRRAKARSRIARKQKTVKQRGPEI